MTMSQGLLRYDMGEGITAFTTDRTLGRDRELLCSLLGVEHFARPHQTHNDKVMRIAMPFFSLSETTQTMLLDGIDAVSSNDAGICVGISTADCIPVLVYDAAHHAAVAIHAGWRGTVDRIVIKAMDHMRQQYGTDASDCRAVIGPGIGLEAFEVGDEVYQAFASEGFAMNAIARRYDKWHINLKECNRLQLVDAGVPDYNIEVCDICTFNDTNYFSARREGAKCGRMLTGFVLG